MNSKWKLISFLVIALSISTSCTKDPVNDTPNDSIYAIRSVFGYGKTHEKFIYNPIGKISEYQSFYFCSRFIYDDKGRLVRKEIATDPDMYSSVSHERSELMTSQNSTFTGFSIFEYELDGELKSVKNYFKKNELFEYTSMTSFEYDGDNIVKWNLHNSADVITQFYAYEYDNNSNVIKEKQYSYLFVAGPEPELIRETTYKYDSKNNPFRIYKETGTPGLYTNTNNIIETSSTLYLDTPGIDKYTTSKTNYDYNEKGFPVKVTIGTTVYEYVYH